LKYSFEVNLFFFLTIAQKGGSTSLPLKEKTFVPTLNGLGRIMNLSYLFLSPLIKMNESLTKT
jgi:hypothetical protein